MKSEEKEATQDQAGDMNAAEEDGQEKTLYRDSSPSKAKSSQSLIKTVAGFSENEERSMWEIARIIKTKPGTEEGTQEKKRKRVDMEKDSKPFKGGANTPQEILVGKKHSFDVEQRATSTNVKEEPEVTTELARSSSPRQQASDRSGSKRSYSDSVTHSPLMHARRSDRDDRSPYHVRVLPNVRNQIDEFVREHKDTSAPRADEPRRKKKAQRAEQPNRGLALTMGRAGYGGRAKPFSPLRQTPSMMGDRSIQELKEFILAQALASNKKKRGTEEEDDEDSLDERRQTLDRRLTEQAQLLNSGDRRTFGSPEADAIDESRIAPEASQMLSYALHYEVKLMRKAFQQLHSHNLTLQTEKLNYKISKQRYVKSLKLKALRAMHGHFLAHFGHKNAKEQANTLQRYLMSRKFLNIWMQQKQTSQMHRGKVQTMREQMHFRTKLNVFMEWQQMSLARQLSTA